MFFSDLNIYIKSVVVKLIKVHICIVLFVRSTTSDNITLSDVVSLN